MEGMQHQKLEFEIEKAKLDPVKSDGHVSDRKGEGRSEFKSSPTSILQQTKCE